VETIKQIHGMLFCAIFLLRFFGILVFPLLNECCQLLVGLIYI